MSQHPHTPGPWFLYTDQVAPPTILAGEQVESPFGVCTEAGDEIASVWCGSSVGHEISVDEANANAQLLAAAPDMLSAIRSSLGSLEAEFGKGRAEVNFPELYAAIAKAEGAA